MKKTSKQILSLCMALALMVAMLASPVANAYAEGGSGTANLAQSQADDGAMANGASTPTTLPDDSSSAPATPANTGNSAPAMPGDANATPTDPPETAAPPSITAFAGGAVSPAAFNGDWLQIEVNGNGNGNLETQIDGALAAAVTKLKITGEMANTDFEFIRNNLSGLEELDLAGIANTSLPANALDNSGSKPSTLGSLTTVTLPDHVTKLGDYAFLNCTALTAVDLSNVTKLGEFAFSGCSELTGVDLSNVTELGISAFAGCKNLSLKDKTNLSTGLTTIPSAAFYKCASLTGVDLSNVTSLGSSAFSGCKNLSLKDKTNLSTDLTTIPYAAFWGCTSLTGVDLSNVTKLGEFAFSGCTSLTGVDLSNVTDLGDSAFEGCTSLNAVALPAAGHFESIGSNSFQNVPALLLLVKGGGSWSEFYGFPKGSAQPSITGSPSVTVGDTLSLSVSPDGGSGPAYQWYKGNSLLPAQTGQTLRIDNVQATHSGAYKCEITLGSVTNTVEREVTVKAAPSISTPPKATVPPNTLPTRRANVPATAHAVCTLGQSYALDIAAIFEDANGDALTYEVELNDGGFNPAAANYTYKPANVGVETLVFRAHDGTGPSTELYIVTLTTKAAPAATETPASSEPAEAENTPTPSPTPEPSPTTPASTPEPTTGPVTAPQPAKGTNIWLWAGLLVLALIVLCVVIWLTAKRRKNR